MVDWSLLTLFAHHVRTSCKVMRVLFSAFQLRDAASLLSTRGSCTLTWAKWQQEVIEVMGPGRGQTQPQQSQMACSQRLLSHQLQTLSCAGTGNLEMNAS